MKITAIKSQVKNPERVSIYVDEKYTFSLGYNQLLEQHIHTGQEINQARIDELKHQSDFGKAYERSLIFAMIRPRSVREMRDYFRRKRWDEEDAELILQKLIAKRYVNDRTFAASWVQSRTLTKSTSKRKLTLELKQKGVADETINAALANSEYDETKALCDLIAKKRKLSRFKDHQKLTHYLARQGFGFDAIKRALQDADFIHESNV